MTVARRVLLGILAVAIVMSVAVMPEAKSCKSTCTGGGSAIPSVIWLMVAATSLVASLMLLRRERHASGSQSLRAVVDGGQS